MNLITRHIVGFLCLSASLLACATGDDPGMTTRRDVPTVRDGMTVVIDVPNGLDVPNIPDVPNAPTDTGVCPMGQMACGRIGCVDTQTDNANCGMCGMDCGMARVCRAGMCACAMGSTQCGATCANTMTDSLNCGACGRACPANQMCVMGACQLNCAMPNSICVAGGVMSCVNLQTDMANCGACATACMAANAIPRCAAGRCGIAACNAGFGDCDMNPANGCEQVLDNVANCGGCGMACAAGANATATCAGNMCGLNCNPGFSNCDMNNGNGCEANTQTDTGNCGACGNACGPGQTCTAGMCRANNTLVGQFNVSAGPAWGTNPPTRTCQEACALLFGGVAATYQCSISNMMITRTANTSIWGVAGCAVVADTFKRGITYNCGSANCSQSAYVSDNCIPGVNYCFR